MEAPSGQVHDVEVATLVTRVAQQAAHSLGVGLGGRAEMEHGVVHRSFAFGQAKLRFFRETREGARKGRKEETTKLMKEFALIGIYINGTGEVIIRKAIRITCSFPHLHKTKMARMPYL